MANRTPPLIVDLSQDDIFHFLSNFFIMFKLIFCLLLCSIESFNADTTTLKILMTTHLTGKADSHGLPCVKAAEIALEAANNDPTFLPGFRIEMHLENDGYPILAPTAVLNFYRQYLIKQFKNNTFGVPLGVGMLHSLGVVRSARALKYVNLNLISVGGQMASMMMSQNLFKTRAELTLYIDAIVGFLEQFKWERLAILSAADSQLGFRASRLLLPKLDSKNISVSWFENIRDLTREDAKSLLESDSRIIFLPNLENPIVNKFLCQLFLHNITGPRFQFIALNTASFFEKSDIPNMVHNGCTVDDLLVQYRQTIFIGSKPYSTVDYERTPISRFGYNYADFKVKFYEKIKGIRPADISDICHCHDGMLHALISLENAEIQLNKANLSLKHVYTHNSEVFQRVNEALSHTRYRGVRNPDVEFNPNMPNDEPIVVQQLTDSDEWIFPYQYQNGKVERRNEFAVSWQNGNPPRDRPKRLEIKEEVPIVIFIIISIVQAILCLVQIIALVSIWARNEHDHRLLTVIGCIFLNIATSMSIIQGNFIVKNTTCGVEVIMLVIGSAILNRGLILGSVNGMFQSRSLGILASTVKNSTSTGHARSYTSSVVSTRPRVSTWPSKRKGKPNKYPKLKLHLLTLLGNMLAVVQLVVLLIWFVTDGVTSETVMIAIDYDQNADQYSETMAEQCVSQKIQTFSLILILANLIPMVIIAMLVLIQRFLQWKTEFRMSAIALINTIFMLFICIVAVVSFKSHFGKQLSIAITSLIISLTCTLAMMISLIRQVDDDRQFRSRIDTGTRIVNFDLKFKIAN